jgi:glycosyltransferase involved in cell wall biosynthesis
VTATRGSRTEARTDRTDRTDRPRDVFLVANNVEELGGVQRVTHNLATMLHERGHRVTVVGIQHAAQPHDYGQRPYRWLVLNERPEPPMPKEAGLRGRLDPRVRAARDAHVAAREAAVGRLSALFAEAADGVVVCMQVWSMNWVAPAATGHLHVIGMSHESFDATLGSTRWERVQQLYRDVDVLLLLTEHDASRFELEGFNNVDVMHNSLSFYPAAASDLSAKVVVAAGRLASEKGYDRLVQAFASVADEHPDWILRIFGEGPLRGRLEKQVASLGLAGRVLLPGLAGDIETELLSSSVFALSSIHEGLPMALAEGMACGLACVAFDCAPGVREIVTDGVDGIVVPPRNVPALAEGLSRLMADEELRRAYGAAGRQSVRRFAPDAVLARWERLFELVDR